MIVGLPALLVLLAAAPDASSLLPARIEGWKLAGPVATYTPETLFEAIDGGADAFLQFDFRDLTSATYTNEKQIELTVDVYHHRDAVRAFGIYSQERRPGADKMPGRLEGVAESDHLAFVAGPFYVKLALPAGGDPATLPRLAEKIAAKLPGPRGLPPVLAAFPDDGKSRRAEKLSARGFLGHSFLHDAAAVPYVNDDARFRLFAVAGKDTADVATMVAAYRAVAKLPKAEVPAAGSLTLEDPLNGPVLLMWDGPWLWGAVDAVDNRSPKPRVLVEALGRRLRQLDRR